MNKPQPPVSLRSTPARRAPKRRGPAPLALEQRLMFDGAAAADVIAKAVDATAAEAPALLAIASDTAPAARSAILAAQPRVAEQLQAILSRDDWRQTLASVFTVDAGSDAWNAAADALRAAMLDGNLGLRIEARSASEMNGALGAFSARGTTGEATIYLNADWLQGASQDEVLTVLVEEIGHAFDARLNGVLDTPGDEGAQFAALTNGNLGTDTAIANWVDTDNSTLNLDGQQVSVELAAPNLNPSSTLWSNFARKVDPNGGNNVTDGGWSAAAPDLIGTSTVPYFQYAFSDSAGGNTASSVLNLKLRIESRNSDPYGVPDAHMVFDLGSGTSGPADGLPEFSLLLQVTKTNQSLADGAGGLVNEGNYTYKVYLLPLVKSTDPLANTLPNNTTIDFSSSRSFIVYDSAADQSTTVSGGTASRTTGNAYNTRLGIFTLSPTPAYSTSPVTIYADNLDGPANSEINSTSTADTLVERYYVLQLDLTAYSKFRDSISTSTNYVTTYATWPTTGQLYGAAGSGTQSNAVNGDIGGGPFKASDPWPYILGFNAAPVPKDNTYTTLEDTALSGRNIITDADPTAGTDSDKETATALLRIYDVTIGATTTVFSSITSYAGTLPDGTTAVSGDGWKELTLANGKGYLKADGSFQYLPGLNKNGTTLDSFTYNVIDDAPDIARTSTAPATVRINVTAVNDAPTAVADTNTAIEAGGASNGTLGLDPTGNVITGVVSTTGGSDTNKSADSDVEDATASLKIASVVNLAKTSSATTVTSSHTSLASAYAQAAGQYGNLRMLADGSYQYLVDNSNATVQALRLSSDTLTETFTYTLVDTGGGATTSTLTITIKGANDNPVAVNDYNTAKESLLSNGTEYTATDPMGSEAKGNVTLNDTDVDGGDGKSLVRLEATATATTIGGATVLSFNSLSSSMVLPTNSRHVHMLRF